MFEAVALSRERVLNVVSEKKEVFPEVRSVMNTKEGCLVKAADRIVKGFRQVDLKEVYRRGSVALRQVCMKASADEVSSLSSHDIMQLPGDEPQRNLPNSRTTISIIILALIMAVAA